MSAISPKALREGALYQGRDGNVRQIALRETACVHYVPIEHEHRPHEGKRFVCSPAYFAEHYATAIAQVQETEEVSA